MPSSFNQILICATILLALTNSLPITTPLHSHASREENTASEIELPLQPKDFEYAANFRNYKRKNEPAPAGASAASGEGVVKSDADFEYTAEFKNYKRDNKLPEKWQASTAEEIVGSEKDFKYAAEFTKYLSEPAELSAVASAGGGKVRREEASAVDEAGSEKDFKYSAEFTKYLSQPEDLSAVASAGGGKVRREEALAVDEAGSEKDFKYSAEFTGYPNNPDAAESVVEYASGDKVLTNIPNSNPDEAVTDAPESFKFKALIGGFRTANFAL